jgi:hypothetical protein
LPAGLGAALNQAVLENAGTAIPMKGASFTFLFAARSILWHLGQRIDNTRATFLSPMTPEISAPLSPDRRRLRFWCTTPARMFGRLYQHREWRRSLNIQVGGCQLRPVLPHRDDGEWGRPSVFSALE